MTDRELTLKGYSTQLDEWEEKIADLKARAQEAKTEETAVHVEKIETLHQKTRRLRENIHKIQGGHEIDWEKEKEAIEQALKDLDEEYRQAWAHFYH